jgi:hypothetical protein
MIGEHLPTFAGASDVATFCPSFASLGEQQKTRVIAEMFVKIAKFESSWNPQTTFQEPPPPKGPGTISRGLFQMSYGDGSGCPNTKAKGDLHDPIVNIDCAVKKAVVLVKKYGLIQNSANHGMARYWSVIRNGHHVDEIRKHTKGFCK